MGKKVKWFGMYYYGSSFSMPDPMREEDVEKFASLKDAKEQIEDVVKWKAKVCPVDGQLYDLPCLEASQIELHLFGSHPLEQDCYPDRILRIGKRGGVQIEKC